MNPSTVFAIHMARLLSQLVNDPAGVEAHRLTVDDLLEANQDAVTLTWDDWKLVVEGVVVPASMPGVRDLVSRMAAHGLRAITFGRASEPGHVLAAVGILAGQPVLGDDGAAAVSQLRRLGVTRVQFVPVRGTPTGTPSAAAAPGSRDSDGAMVLDDFELYELGEPHPFGGMTPRSTAEIPVLPTPVAMPTVPPVSIPEAPPPAGPRTDPNAPVLLIERLHGATTPNTLAHALDTIGAVVWADIGAHRLAAATYLTSELIRFESTLQDADARRSVQLAMRRIGESHLIALVAADLSRSRERRPQYMAILNRFGDTAVDVLLEQLAYAELARERRALFDAILELGRGVPTLLRMLADDRWYVARNAAALLGRLKAVGAEAPLAGALRHDEVRVRHAAAQALTKLGTPEAVDALRVAIRDPAPAVREQAILALADRRESSFASLLLRTVDTETDPDVLRAMHVALGRIGTPDAIRRLIATAVDGGGLFRRGRTPLRVAAVKGLVEAQTPEAEATIRELTQDRDPAVRDTAEKGIAVRIARDQKQVPNRGW